MVRRFAVIGQKASASEEFLLYDLAGTSGRLDVLVRCLRAAFLFSHGLRTNVVVYLVLLGGARAPRVVRIDGSAVRFLRPDERALAVLLQKVLAARPETAGWVEVKSGIAVASAGFEAVLADASAAATFVLKEGASDIRSASFPVAGELLFVLGDHLGLPAAVEEALAGRGAHPIGVGPVSLHTEDVVAIVTNELDRREPGPSP
jgi:tRNA (pseudouridine54-N1)-methyltransferase